jgi:hypothetical protein
MHWTKENHQSNKTINQTCAWLQYQHKKGPVAITIGQQNSSSLKHTTCTLEDGQLGQNTWVKYTEEERWTSTRAASRVHGKSETKCQIITYFGLHKFPAFKQHQGSQNWQQCKNSESMPDIPEHCNLHQSLRYGYSPHDNQRQPFPSLWAKELSD